MIKWQNRAGKAKRAATLPRPPHSYLPVLQPAGQHLCNVIQVHGKQFLHLTAGPPPLPMWPQSMKQAGTSFYRKGKKHNTEAVGLGVCFQERLSSQKKNKGVGEGEASPYSKILLNCSVVVSSHSKAEGPRCLSQ